TLWGECQKIADYAPRLAEPIKWIVSECVRAYSEAIFVEIGKVAGAVRNALQTSTTSDERKLEWLARAQDCSRLASKVYSHGATYFYSGVSATGYDAIRVVAKEGAEWALKTYASRIGFEADSEWDKFAKSGLLARAVLGNQKATRILDALKAGAFTISSKGQHDGMGGRHVALVLSPDESDAFNPPILVGYVAPNLVEKQGTPVALIRGNMYAILRQYADSGLETDGDAPYLDKIKTGAFTIENEIRDAGLGVSPAMILKSGGVNNYYQNMIRRLLVPLGLITIRQATIDDYSNTHDLRQLVDDLVWKFKYERVYGSKKDAEGYPRVIVFKKSSAKNTNHYPEDIVWISPDPFAKTGKKGAK
ncbi:MAG: hypothetical protein EBU84_08045, partial [Actinobacteria bacterium]|nr:hypothetical protein [Actinomycetota bacterium]